MRVNPFDLGAPVKWYRELCNMQEVAYPKIQRINRNISVWNDNALPEYLYDLCYQVAEYEAQSLNKEDQIEQKTLYKKMFESVKSYDEDFHLKVCKGEKPYPKIQAHPSLDFLKKLINLYVLTLSMLFGICGIIQCQEWKGQNTE